MNTLQDLIAIAPLVLTAVGFLAVLLVETLDPERRSPVPLGLTVLTLAAALVLALRPAALEEPFGGMLAMDRFSRGFQPLILGSALLAALACQPYFKNLRLPAADAYALLLASVTGMLVVVAARDLLVLFLGIELLSIPLYVLASYRRLQSISVEGGFKYFLIGAFASSFLVYGIALLYGATGSTLYSRVALAAAAPGVVFRLGTALLLIGLAFKVAAAPFHSWAPDVYQGAPTPVTGFMAAAVKASAFGGLLRLVVEVLPHSPALLQSFTCVAAITMIVGNLGALLQNNLKRLLAYSSVAHAGYVLVGVTAASAAPDSGAPRAVLFYLFTYAFMTLGAFGTLVFFVREDREGLELSSLQGLSRKHPLLAFSLALMFLSLAGFPFTAGFFGKVQLLLAAWRGGLTFLSIVLVLTSIVSLYYYLRVVVALYMKPALGEPALSLRSPALSFVTLACAAGILFLGLYPGPLIHALF